MSRLTFGLIALALAPAPAVRAADADSAHPQTALINEQIAAKWKEAEIKKTAGPATDHEFLRRVFIDLIGRIATPEEVIDFEQDRSKDKRARLVNRLLNSTEYYPRVNGQRVPRPGAKGEFVKFDYAYEYAEHWADVWTVWLMSRTGDPRYRDQMRLWLLQAFLENRSHRDVVTQLLTATGKTNENGAVNFVAQQLGEPVPPPPAGLGAEDRAEKDRGRFDAVPITSRVTRLFLGIQTQCTQCHDHPFNREWVQSDFWGVNAFFRQTTLKGTPTRPGANNQAGPNLAVVELVDDPSLNPTGRIFWDRRDGKLMASKPNFLKDMAQAEKNVPPNKTVPPDAARTRRELLAEYVVTHDNFARAYVSRIWSHLFGRGLHKEPAADDFGNFSGENPVVHDVLLEKLAEEFVRYQYNPKLLLEWVCTSDVYQLSHVGVKEYTDPKYDPYFARMPLKALAPEVLFDSLMVATKAETAASEERKARRARWMARLVQQFGDDEGNEQTFNGTIIQALLMMNGREINDEIGTKGANAVTRVVAKHTRGVSTNVDAVLDELFLMALNRRPTGSERVRIKTLQQRGALLKGEAPRPADPPAGGPKSPRKGPRQKGPLPPAVPGVVLPTVPGDPTFYQDVFWALLNTNEFMLNH